jgi:cytoskeletal protein RodZ
MKINGKQVSPVEDKKTKGIPATQSKSHSKKRTIALMIVMILVVSSILAGLVFFAIKTRPSGKASMSASTSQVSGSESSDANNSKAPAEDSGGVLRNKVSVKDVSVEDDSLGYNISVVSYIPEYKASDGSTVMLVEYMAKPIGSVYSLVDTSALKLKINDKVISSSSDYNMEMSKLNLNVFESTQAAQEVDGWLAYPYNGDSKGVTLYYDRGTVSVDSTLDSAGIVKPEMKKEILLSPGE